MAAPPSSATAFAARFRLRRRGLVLLRFAAAAFVCFAFVAVALSRSSFAAAAFVRSAFAARSAFTAAALSCSRFAAAAFVRSAFAAAAVSRSSLRAAAFVRSAFAAAAFRGLASPPRPSPAPAFGGRGLVALLLRRLGPALLLAKRCSLLPLFAEGSCLSLHLAKRGRIGALLLDRGGPRTLLPQVSRPCPLRPILGPLPPLGRARARSSLRSRASSRMRAAPAAGSSITARLSACRRTSCAASGRQRRAPSSQ